MELNYNDFKKLIHSMNDKMNLVTKGLHVAAMFEDNEHDEIIGWFILDEENNEVERYYGADGLMQMLEKYCENE